MNKKEKPLSLLVKEAEITRLQIRLFVIENAMIDPNFTTEEKSEEINKILYLNKFEGMKDAMRDVCQAKHKREIIKNHLLNHRDSLARLYVPDEYMTLVSKINFAAYNSFSQTDVAQEVITSWLRLAPEFIDMKTGYYKSVSDKDKTGEWLLRNEYSYPSPSSYAKERLAREGLTIAKLVSFSNMAAIKLTEEWNKALCTDKVPMCQTHEQSCAHPADACSVTMHPKGYYYYTLTEKHNALIDLRYLMHISFHEPEHVFQRAFGRDETLIPQNHPLQRATKDFSSTFNLGLFCAVDVFDVDELGSYPPQDNLGFIAYSLYRKATHEISAHQHGYLAELQFRKKTGLPIRPETRDFLKSNNRYTEAIPKSLVPKS